jgi:predicted DNA binding protein
MREFVFDLVYETTAGPLERLLTDPREVSSTGIGGSIDETEFWRIERFEGPSDALNELADADQSDLLGVEQITDAACEGSVHRDVLKRTDGKCELYYHLRSLKNCESIGTLAVEYIGSDVLFEVNRNRGHETWTVMMETEDGVGLFYDAVQVSLQEGIRFEFGHIGQASQRRTALFASKNLPPEQREALVEAVGQGYYEKPRQITLEELSEELDCPRSTLSYRLRSAESKLAKAFATNEQPTELEIFPQTVDQRGDS